MGDFSGKSFFYFGDIDNMKDRISKTISGNLKTTAFFIFFDAFNFHLIRGSVKSGESGSNLNSDKWFYFE